VLSEEVVATKRGSAAVVVEAEILGGGGSFFVAAARVLSPALPSSAPSLPAPVRASAASPAVARGALVAASGSSAAVCGPRACRLLLAPGVLAALVVRCDPAVGGGDGEGGVALAQNAVLLVCCAPDLPHLRRAITAETASAKYSKPGCTAARSYASNCSAVSGPALAINASLSALVFSTASRATVTAA